MAPAATKSEPDEEERQRLGDRVLGLLEDAVHWAIAVVLVVGSVALLVAQFNTRRSWCCRSRRGKPHISAPLPAIIGV
jgi:hypothetical protein